MPLDWFLIEITVAILAQADFPIVCPHTTSQAFDDNPACRHTLRQATRLWKRCCALIAAAFAWTSQKNIPETHPRETVQRHIPEKLSRDTPRRNSPETHPGETLQRHIPEKLSRDTPQRNSPETYPRETLQRHIPEKLSRDTPQRNSPETHPRETLQRHIPEKHSRDTSQRNSPETHPSDSTPHPEWRLSDKRYQ